MLIEIKVSLLLLSAKVFFLTGRYSFQSRNKRNLYNDERGVINDFLDFESLTCASPAACRETSNHVVLSPLFAAEQLIANN